MFSSISFSVFFSSTKITFSFSKYLLPFPSPFSLSSQKKFLLQKFSAFSVFLRICREYIFILQIFSFFSFSVILLLL